MSIRVHIGGRVCLPEEAKISVFDRGFLYGDSVYETIGTAYGRLFAAKDHLVRLERSAERIGLRAPPRAEPLAKRETPNPRMIPDRATAEVARRARCRRS